MSGWLRGVVKEVPSGDTVVVVAGAKPGQVPPEKRITLASLVAPKLVRRVRRGALCLPGVMVVFVGARKTWAARSACARRRPSPALTLR